jgi:hypothetical protein
MHTVVVRVWLPDRPGALGQVASRIGSVRGDVLAIEILEVGGGRVIDELVVGLADESLVDLMVNEVHAIDGVSVEHVRPIAGEYTDGGLLALALAADVLEAEPNERIDRFARCAARLTEGDWVILADDDHVLASWGDAPNPDFVSSLVAGRSHLGEAQVAVGDLFWVGLPRTGAWLAVGRSERPIHARERDRLELFARVVDPILT